jgi:hypothetical protein
LSSKVHSLLRRTALSVYRDSGDFLRKPRRQPAGACDIASLCTDGIAATPNNMFLRDTAENWIEKLGENSPVSVVYSLPEAFSIASSQGLVDKVAVVGPVPRLSGYSHRVGDVVRTPDENRAEILREIGMNSMDADGKSSRG